MNTTTEIPKPFPHASTTATHAANRSATTGKPIHFRNSSATEVAAELGRPVAIGGRQSATGYYWVEGPPRKEGIANPLWSIMCDRP